jgi:mandelate racemase
MAAAARTALPQLTIQGVQTRAVDVPMRFPLGTSAATVRSAPQLLVDLRTAEGVTGRTYLFCYRRELARALDVALRDALSIVAGDPAAPLEVAAKLGRRLALAGVTGLVRMAAAAIDVALWDALAVAAGLPLATLLGARPRAVPAYNSSGLGLMPAAAAAGEAEQLLERGFRAVKVRLGHPTLDEDLAVLRAVRARVGPAVALPVDYNQALPVAEAIRRGAALDAEGIAWLEEPTRHDDWAGNAAIARAVRAPLQLGENFNGPAAMEEALRAGACDLVMPDVARIGGVTGFLHAAGVAAAHGVPISTHLHPEVSAHLLAASPTAHLLEYVDWADAILEEPLAVVDGAAQLPDRPGIGLAWRREAVEALAIG